ncbi:MAG TPA: glutamine-hydrolyzing carbamoyl-phosphate synthase small subunit [Thermoanaerobaculia bacterium]|nr:glutamine-hydrolyzing carbamoyl-phosphate synthase small subunit [Thermoanaerobaculia bacterium]
MVGEPRAGLLLLEDGSVFRGQAVSPGSRFGEVVFNTSMTGYQEILTDPSYLGQIVVMTQPHIGNYGVREAVAESARPWVEGFVARRLTARPSSHLAEAGLPAYLRRHRIPALEGIDTRAVVRRLRQEGALRGVLTSERDDVEALLAEVRATPAMEGRCLALEAGAREPYVVPAQGEERCHLALWDFGAKSNIVRSLTRRGARVTVLPAATPAARAAELGVDGVVLSNGPGDPATLAGPIAEIRRLLEGPPLPLLGICLGHQLLGLALGGRTFKLKFGHHGGNQPVKDLASGRTLITSQNHGFAVDPGSLPPQCRVTEVNLNDGTVEGFAVAGQPVLSVQYHPEAAPGPHEAATVFDAFLAQVCG